MCPSSRLMTQAPTVTPGGVRQKNPHFMNYFASKLSGREKEKGIGTKMRVKLAAKMLIIAWTLMKKKEVFDPGYLKD